VAEEGKGARKAPKHRFKLTEFLQSGWAEWVGFPLDARARGWPRHCQGRLKLARPAAARRYQNIGASH
jgi:hypothetical protein